MTLRPIPGAPPGATVPDFPTADCSAVVPEPFKSDAPPPAIKLWEPPDRHVRLAPKKGHGGKELLVGLRSNGGLALYPNGESTNAPTVELGPFDAREFVRVWRSEKDDEFRERAGAFQIVAGWKTRPDGDRVFSVLALYDGDRTGVVALHIAATLAAARKTLKALSL